MVDLIISAHAISDLRALKKFDSINELFNFKINNSIRWPNNNSANFY